MSVLRQILRIGACSALALATLHGLCVALALRTGLGGLAPRVRAQLDSIGMHLAFFQLELVVAVLLTGFLAGLLASWTLLAFARTLQTWKGVTLSLAYVGLWMAREVAHRPAMFEDLLWRRGGFRRVLERWLVEDVGFGCFDRAAVCMALVLLLATAWRHRPRLRANLGKAAALAGIALVLLLSRALRPQARPRPPARSIVILAADSLRADHLSSEGYPRATTPNIDALRKKGARMSEIFVPIASTTASWTSMLTGLDPHHHGIRDLFPREEQTRLHAPLLPELLHRAGYETSVVSDYAGESFNRIELGFQTVKAPPATNLEIFAEREMLQGLPLALALFTGPWAQRLLPVARYLPVNADVDALTDRVEQELARLEGTGKPFLLVAFYSVTHLPFASTMPDVARFTSPGYRGPSRYGYELQQLQDIDRLGELPSDEEVAQIRALYDGALFGFDRQVGRMRERLDRDGLGDVTFVVTGDHGENLFEPGTTTEHGKWFRGGALANRTPLVVAGAAVAHVPAWPSHAGGSDLMPTLLDLAQLPVPDGLDGQSLLRAAPKVERTYFAETTLWLGGARDTPPGAMSYPPVLDLLEVEPGSHALVLRRRFEDVTVTAKLRAAFQPPWLLVHTPNAEGGGWELFDLQNDPWERADQSATHPELAQQLRQRLLAWMRADPLRWLDAADRLVKRVEE